MMTNIDIKDKHGIVQSRAEVCDDDCLYWDLVVLETGKGYCILCGDKCYKGDKCKVVNKKAIKRTLQ